MSVFLTFKLAPFSYLYFNSIEYISRKNTIEINTI